MKSHRFVLSLLIIGAIIIASIILFCLFYGHYQSNIERRFLTNIIDIEHAVFSKYSMKSSNNTNKASIRGVDIGWKKDDFYPNQYALGNEVKLSENTKSSLTEVAFLIVTLDGHKCVENWNDNHKAQIVLLCATRSDILTPQEKEFALKIGSNYYFFAMEGDHLPRKFYNVTNETFFVNVIHSALQYTSWTIPDFENKQEVNK